MTTDKVDDAVRAALQTRLPQSAQDAQTRAAARDSDTIDQAKRIAQAFNYAGPPREKVLVGLPVFDFKPWAGCVAGLMQCLPFYLQPLIMAGNANIGLVRNEIVHAFLNRPEFAGCEWLVWVDADIEFSMQDWALLMEGSEDIATAEYACKILGEPPVRSGLGFTRIHRSVFNQIAELRDTDGGDLVPRFFHKGELMVDFHPTGATPMSDYLGEDQAFYRWAQMARATIRREQRTRLKHWGVFCYQYPDQIPGMKIVTAQEYAAEVERGRAGVLGGD